MSENDTEPFYALQRYRENIAKGMRKGGIRPNMRAKNIERLCEVLAMGDSEEFSTFTADLLGESAGLSAGQSLRAKEAMQAVYDAQAMLFVQIRQDNPVEKENMYGCKELLERHRDALNEWLISGAIKNYPDSELVKFSELLYSVRLRCNIAASTVGAVEIMIQALALFVDSSDLVGGTS